MNNKSITIKSPSRLHITLIDMNGSQGRLDGSVGIALEYPCFKIRFAADNTLKFNGCDNHLKEKIRKIYTTFAENYRLVPGLKCEVIESIPSHCGLGGGTQLSLIIAQAINTIYDFNLDVPGLSHIVQRGGTSGLGTYFFMKGGFLVDGGHRKIDKKTFLPSGFTRGAPLPPALFHHPVPDEWKVALCIPENDEGLSGVEEKDFMSKTCPIDEHEVEKACRIILMKMMPAVKEGNFNHFCESVTYLQDNGWKKYHWQRPGNRKNYFLREVLPECGLSGIGLSSTGNTVFGFYKYKRGVEDNIQEQFSKQLIKSGAKSGDYKLIFTHINLKGSTYNYED